MSTSDKLEAAIDVLQELGLKEYEAKCFVGLTRLSTGTAKQLSEVTDVPRTRVYDAIRVLEVQGLVEIQHSSPQQFRAVPLAEATETLRDRYEDRVADLRDALVDVERVEEGEDDVRQEVWSMSGKTAIANRANSLIEDAEDEIVLVVGDESLLTEELLAALFDANADPDVDLIVGAVTGSVQEQIAASVPDATTFVSGLGWLHGEETDGDVAIGRLLLVDRSTFLVSSIMADSSDEQAIFGSGFENGLVVIARRLMAQGLVQGRDPGQRIGE